MAQDPGAFFCRSISNILQTKGLIKQEHAKLAPHPIKLIQPI